jgi:hypothetical protein
MQGRAAARFHTQISNGHPRVLGQLPCRCSARLNPRCAGGKMPESHASALAAAANQGTLMREM